MNERNISSANIKEKEGEKKIQRNDNRFATLRYYSKEIEQAKIFHGDEDIIFNINANPNNMKRDLLLFKDEILKEIKIFKSNLIEKSLNNEKYMNDNINKFSIQIEEFNRRIIDLSNLIITDKKIREKVEQFAEFKEKVQETIMTDGIKIVNLEKDFYENIYRIDNILKDTVLNSKIIGGIAKYNTFYDFMSKVTDELSLLNTFKDKTNSDMNNFKSKFENYTNKAKAKTENVEKESKLYTDKFIKKTEIKMNDLFDEYNNRLNEVKFQNVSYSENIKKMTEDLFTQINNIKMIKNEIYDKFEEYSKLIKKDNSKILNSLSGYKEEFYNIKKKYIEIANTIKYKGDLKNLNFEFKSPYNKNKKRSLKSYNRVDPINLLKINKIEFDNGNFEDNKNDIKNFSTEKRLSLKTSFNCMTRKKDNLGIFSLQNNINNPLNKLSEKNISKNNITKSVLRPFKIFNNSNSQSNSNNNSIIKEEGNYLFSNREKSNRSEYKTPLKENKIAQNILINENENKNGDIKEEIKRKNTLKLDNKNKDIIDNKLNQDQKPVINIILKAKAQRKIDLMPSEQTDLFNKITLSLDNVNNIDYYPKQNDKEILEKEIMKNVNNMINKGKINYKSNKGYPKIVTNNGEKIIISTRPINNNNKFISYTSPNISALNNCVQKLYGNKRRKITPKKSKSIREENDFDLFFANQTEKNINNLKNNLFEERINSARPNSLLLFRQGNTNNY